MPPLPHASYVTEVIINFGLHVLHFELSYKHRQITSTEITKEVLAATKACAQKL